MRYFFKKNNNMMYNVVHFVSFPKKQQCNMTPSLGDLKV